ncbi:MAG TPA: hypothetical protein VHU88_11775 [Sporichthyaceae bacterium]|jgi:hypothetical protein|nr:hypothetical protein [Sporichthyaceae bacterium]
METTTAVPEDPPSQAVDAQLDPEGPMGRLMAAVPRALSSHAHIIFLALLGIYLVVLPLFGVDVSAKAELIGGNYTNVTSDLGACIAAGMTVHLVKRDRTRSAEIAGLLHAMHERHEALHQRVDTAVLAAQRAEAAATSRGPNEAGPG